MVKSSLINSCLTLYFEHPYPHIMNNKSANKYLRIIMEKLIIIYNLLRVTTKTNLYSKKINLGIQRLNIKIIFSNLLLVFGSSLLCVGFLEMSLYFYDSLDFSNEDVKETLPKRCAV